MNLPELNRPLNDRQLKTNKTDKNKEKKKRPGIQTETFPNVRKTFVDNSWSLLKKNCLFKVTDAIELITSCCPGYWAFREYVTQMLNTCPVETLAHDVQKDKVADLKLVATFG